MLQVTGVHGPQTKQNNKWKRSVNILQASIIPRKKMEILAVRVITCVEYKLRKTCIVTEISSSLASDGKKPPKTSRRFLASFSVSHLRKSRLSQLHLSHNLSLKNLHLNLLWADREAKWQLKSFRGQVTKWRDNSEIYSRLDWMSVCGQSNSWQKVQHLGHSHCHSTE